MGKRGPTQIKGEEFLGFMREHEGEQFTSEELAKTFGTTIEVIRAHVNRHKDKIAKGGTRSRRKYSYRGTNSIASKPNGNASIPVSQVVRYANAETKGEIYEELFETTSGEKIIRSDSGKFYIAREMA